MEGSWGVSVTAPLESGSPISKGTFAQGGVLGSPTAVRTLKTFGSVLSSGTVRHISEAVDLQAGVKRTPSTRTLSVSFGVVAPFVMRILTSISCPTVADPGTVGTAEPPIPASAGVAPRRHAQSSAITAPSPTPSRFATQTLRIAPPPRGAPPDSHECLKGNSPFVRRELSWRELTSSGLLMRVSLQDWTELRNGGPWRAS